MSHHPIRNYLLTGLLVWIPVIVTLVVINFVVTLLDKTVSILPHVWQPQQLIGVNIPGLGMLLSLVILFLTGMVATNVVGKRLMGWGEAIVARIPLVRTIYNAVKQVIHTVFSNQTEAFSSVVLVEYPRKGLWSIAFVTGSGSHEVQQAVDPDMLTIFVPTTPNPTSGFLMMLPRKDTVTLEMTVEEALKYVISLGVVLPREVTSTTQTNPV